MVQLCTVVEHLLIAVLLQLRGRQLRGFLDALTAVEHILIAALRQGGGGQYEQTLGIVHEFLGTCEQAVEGIVGLDGCRALQIVLTLQQAHHITEDLGLHARTDVDVLRTVVNSSCATTGACHGAASQRGVDAVELHHIVLLHDDVVGTLGVLDNSLLSTAVDGIVDVVGQDDAIVEGDGDLAVGLSYERQRRCLIDIRQLFG